MALCPKSGSGEYIASPKYVLAGEVREARLNLTMSWPIAAIIALVSLLATCAPVLLVIWRFAEQKKRISNILPDPPPSYSSVHAPHSLWWRYTIRSESRLEAVFVSHEAQHALERALPNDCSNGNINA